MSTFKPGEIVDITIKGVRINEVDQHGCVSIIAKDCFDGEPASWRLPPQAAVERVAPAGWPPRIGDVWRDKDGDPWFAISADKLVSPSASRYGAMLDTVVSVFGPLTLVHREDEQDGGAS